MRSAASLRVLVEVAAKKAAAELKLFDAAVVSSKKNADSLTETYNKLGKETDTHTQKVEKSTKGWSDFSKKAITANQTLGLISKSIRLIKWPAMIVGAGAAANALTAAAGGAVALVAALAPLAGLATVAGSAMIASFQVKGVLAVSGIKDVTAALGGLNEKMDQTSSAFKQLSPEGQKFAKTLNQLKGPIRDMQESVSKPLFEGLTKGLKSAKGVLPAVEKILVGTAKAMGRIGEQVGKWIGSDAFSKDLAKIGKTNNEVLGKMGKVAVRLGKSLMDVLVVARPLTEWVGKLADRWSKALKSAVETARANGDLASFFEKTKDVAQQLIRIGRNLGQTIWNIGKAAAPLGRQLLQPLVKGSKELAKWSETTRGENQIKTFFEDIKPPLFEAGKLLKAVTASFFEISKGPDLLSPLLKTIRKDMLPILTQLVRQTTASFGPKLVQLLTSVANVMLDLAGTNGPLNIWVDTISRLLDAFDWLLDHVPGLQQVVSTLLGFKAVMAAMNFVGLIDGAKAAATRLGLLGATATATATEVVAANEAMAASQQMALPGLAPGGKLAGLKGYASKVAGRAGPALGAGLAASLAGGAIGGKVGNAVSSMGTMAAAGFAVAGPWGAAGGAVAGLLKEAIWGGLFESGPTRLEKAADHAGEVLMTGFATSIKSQGDVAVKAFEEVGASIEETIDTAAAAPAVGSVGKGFAVIPDQAGEAAKETRETVKGMVRDLKKNYGSLVAAGADMTKKQREAFKHMVLEARQASPQLADELHHISRAFDNSGVKIERMWQKASDATGESVKRIKTQADGMTVRVSKNVEGMVNVVGDNLHILTSNVGKALGSLDVKTGPEWAVQHALTTGTPSSGNWAGNQTGAVVSAVGGKGFGDKVKTALEPGEVVWNKAAVKKYFGTPEKANIVNTIEPRWGPGKGMQSGGVAGDGPPGATVPHPRLTGGTDVLKTLGQRSIDTTYKAAMKYLEAHMPAGPRGGGASFGPKGIGSYGGLPMANWVVEALKYAAGKGVNPQPTSGYRSHAYNVAQGRNYYSEHEGTQYPHGAVDYGSFTTGYAAKMSVVNATRDFKYPLLAPIGFEDDGHASGTGHQRGGMIGKGYNWPGISRGQEQHAYGLMHAMESHDRIGKYVRRWNRQDDAVKTTFAMMMGHTLNPQHWSVYEDGTIARLKAGGIVTRPIPAPLQKWNKQFAKHVSPDYGGVQMPVNLWEMAAEFFGMPGRSGAQIVHGEANYRPGAVGDDRAAGYGNTFGYGGYQITTGASGMDSVVNRIGGYDQMTNPIWNTIVASKMYHDRGWSPWHGTQYLGGGSDHWMGQMPELVAAGGKGGANAGTGGGSGGSGQSMADIEWEVLRPVLPEIAKKQIRHLANMRRKTGNLQKLITHAEIVAGLNSSPGGSETTEGEKNKQIKLWEKMLRNLQGRSHEIHELFDMLDGNFPKERKRFMRENKMLHDITGQEGSLLWARVGLDALTGKTSTDAAASTMDSRALREFAAAVQVGAFRTSPYLGPMADGGVALVGERGPELRHFPTGTRVHSADDTRDLLAPEVNVFVDLGDGVMRQVDARIEVHERRKNRKDRAGRRFP